jgi:hypothetical protein
MGKVERKIGIHRTDVLRTDGIMDEMFGFWETCMNTCRSGNMHKKRKMKKGEKSSEMEIKPSKNKIRYQELGKQNPH